MMACLDDSGYNETNAQLRMEIVHLRDQIVRFKDVLRSIEFTYNEKFCPHCHGYDGAKENPFLHIPECPVARVLRSDSLVQMVYDPKDEIREAYRKHDAGFRLRDK